MTTYLVPAGFGEGEYIQKKSRFIGRVWLTETEDEAIARIKEMREKHWDATHNVYAYIIREGGAMRYSDDGEPGGTSGLPTLDVFRKGEIFNVCCVVTRYFGGTLLGAGGLVRAYGSTAKIALDAAGICRMASWDSILMSCTYAQYEKMKRILEDYEAVIEDTDFGVDILIEALVRQDKTQDFIGTVTDTSAGQVSVEVTGTRFMGVRII